MNDPSPANNRIDHGSASSGPATTLSPSDGERGQFHSDRPAVIVVTRFAIHWKGVLPSRDWIDHRFDLLRETAFPSLRQQTVGNFDWVVLADARWHDYTARLFEEIALPCGNIHVAPCLPSAEIQERSRCIWVADCGVALESLERIYPGETRFITFRLDSDDALSRRAVERVLAADLPVEPIMLFNLPRGIQVNWLNGDLLPLTHEAHYQGPFLAVKNVSRRRMLNFGGNHNTARQGLRVLDVAGVNWAQVVHGANLCNRMKGSRKLLNFEAHCKRRSTAPASDVSEVDTPGMDSYESEVLAEFGIRVQPHWIKTFSGISPSARARSS